MSNTDPFHGNGLIAQFAKAASRTGARSWPIGAPSSNESGYSSGIAPPPSTRSGKPALWCRSAPWAGRRILRGRPNDPQADQCATSGLRCPSPEPLPQRWSCECWPPAPFAPPFPRLTMPLAIARVGMRSSARFGNRFKAQAGVGRWMPIHNHPWPKKRQPRHSPPSWSPLKPFKQPGMSRQKHNSAGNLSKCRELS
jgi:hypothetical protein